VEAEACFRTAIEVACHQRAKWHELRAVMSLCHMWRRQGKTAEARHMLAESYGWFTEGLDTPYLAEARALLATLDDASSSTRRGARLPRSAR
jgi:hypothetical protein